MKSLKVESNFNNLLNKEGFYLYSIESNRKELKNKIAFGKVIKFWYQEENNRYVLLKTGIKKDIIFNLGTVDEDYILNKENNFIESCLENKNLPFFYNSKKLEDKIFGTVGYDYANYGTIKNINKLGKLGAFFGFFLKNYNSNILLEQNKTLLIKGKVYKKVTGGYVILCGDYKYFLPYGESLIYYMSSFVKKDINKDIIKVFDNFFKVEKFLVRGNYDIFLEFLSLQNEQLNLLKIKLIEIKVNLRNIFLNIVGSQKKVLLVWIYMYFYINNLITISNKLIDLSLKLKQNNIQKNEIINFKYINECNLISIDNTLEFSEYIFKFLKKNSLKLSNENLVFIYWINKILLENLLDDSLKFDLFLKKWDLNYFGGNYEIYKNLITFRIENFIRKKYKLSMVSRRRLNLNIKLGVKIK